MSKIPLRTCFHSNSACLYPVDIITCSHYFSALLMAPLLPAPPSPIFKVIIITYCSMSFLFLWLIIVQMNIWPSTIWPPFLQPLPMGPVTPRYPVHLDAFTYVPPSAGTPSYPFFTWKNAGHPLRPSVNIVSSMKSFYSEINLFLSL